MIITPISNIGTRDNRKRNKDDKQNKKNESIPISFKEFLWELHLEQTEQS
jgi:hypothetical protein